MYAREKDARENKVTIARKPRRIMEEAEKEQRDSK